MSAAELTHLSAVFHLDAKALKAGEVTQWGQLILFSGAFHQPDFSAGQVVLHFKDSVPGLDLIGIRAVQLLQGPGIQLRNFKIRITEEFQILAAFNAQRMNLPREPMGKVGIGKRG